MLLKDYISKINLNSADGGLMSIFIPVSPYHRRNLTSGFASSDLPQSVVMEMLYDLNLNIVGCEISSDGKLSVAISLDSVAYENKKALDHHKCLSVGLESYWSSLEPRGETVVFLEYQADIENDTIASAGINMSEAIGNLGLVHQDVVYGNITLDDAVRWYRTTDEKELLNHLRDGYPERIIRDGRVWESEELYIKHCYYRSIQDVKKGAPNEPFTIEGIDEESIIDALGDEGL